ncbi:MAG: LPXTG cell wall anchor domain-containing protein [Enterococcus canintestini]
MPKTGEIMNHSGVIIGLLVIIVVFFIAVIKHTRKK